MRAEKAFLALSLILPLCWIGHPLWEVDDARYAEIPREMLVTGDWTTPRLDFVRYVEKPPLPYWLGAASYSLFGVHEWSARLPLAVLAALCLLGTYALGAFLFDKRTGVYASVILGTGMEFFLLSHLLTPDLSLTAALLGAQGFLMKGILTEGPVGEACVALSGAFCGAAFLCKGLIGILFPALWAGSALVFPSLRENLVRPSLRSLSSAAVLFLGIASPWFLAMQRRYPGFARFFIWEQHFLRYTTPAFHRGKPWYFFLAVDALGFLPWTPFLAAGVCRVLRPRPADPYQLKLLLLSLWAGEILLFFSVSHSQLPTYILPIFPHQALISAVCLSRLKTGDKESHRVRNLSALAAILVLAAAMAAIPLSRPYLPLWATQNHVAARAASVLLVLAASLFSGAFLLSSRMARRLLPVIPVLALGGILSEGLLMSSASALSDALSAKSLCAEINRNLRPGDKILGYRTYLHGLPFYTGRAVTVVDWRQELAYAYKTGEFKDRFGDDKTIRSLPPKGRRAFVVLRKKDAPNFMKLVLPSKIKEVRTYGDWLLAVF